MSVVKCDPTTKVKNRQGDLVEIKVFDVGAKEWLDRVQNRFLYPIVLRLSDLSSKKNDFKYFILGVLCSAFFSLIVGLLSPKLLEVLPWFQGNKSMCIEEIKDLKQMVLEQTYKLDSIRNVKK